MAFADYDDDALGEHNDLERCPHGVPLADECLSCEDDDELEDDDPDDDDDDDDPDPDDVEDDD